MKTNIIGIYRLRCYQIPSLNSVQIFIINYSMIFSWLEVAGIGFGVLGGCMCIILSMEIAYWRAENYVLDVQSDSDNDESAV